VTLLGSTRRGGGRRRFQVEYGSLEELVLKVGATKAISVIWMEVSGGGKEECIANGREVDEGQVGRDLSPTAWGPQ